MRKTEKTPTVLIVVTEEGVQRSLILAREDDAVGQETGYRLLAKIAPQLVAINSALRGAAAVSAV